jgi:hypothetical protein
MSTSGEHSMSAGCTHPDATSPDPPGSPGPAADLDLAFQRFRDVLAADGYDLRWSVTAQDRVVVEIQAGPEACADCLVPLPVMEAIMSDALAPTPYALDHIVLPAKG